MRLVLFLNSIDSLKGPPHFYLLLACCPLELQGKTKLSLTLRFLQRLAMLLVFGCLTVSCVNILTAF